MTMTNTSLSITHNCTGTTGPYAFTFGVTSDAAIKVILTDASGTQTILVKDTDYTVAYTAIDWTDAGVANKWDYSLGGVVTTVASYAAGNTITIKAYDEIIQDKSFLENIATLYKVFENALDKLTRICKEQDERIVALEVAAIGAGAGGTTGITYLGKLAADPDTSGWGMDEAVTMWSVLMDDGEYQVRYWSGAQILVLG